MSDQKADQKGEGKIVNIACRATVKCEGQTAAMKIIKQNNLGGLAGGGRTIRYTCQDCGRPFVISS
jgi:hypothetical protein